MTDRQALIDKLTPKRRYQDPSVGLVKIPSAKMLFAATDTNAGYILLTNEAGELLPLTASLLGDVVQEAKLYGVKLKNMRIFGARGGIKRVPAGGRFYAVERLAA